MPRFIDVHKDMPEMPAEMVQEIKDRIASGEKDEFGAVAVDVLAGNDGSAFCISDAPDIASVQFAHVEGRAAGGWRRSRGSEHGRQAVGLA